MVTQHRSMFLWYLEADYVDKCTNSVQDPKNSLSVGGQILGDMQPRRQQLSSTGCLHK